jgi:RNA polymerase sigma-70 factor (ECF subfamily)
LALDVNVFVRHVAERSSEGRLPLVGYAADLYIACACAHNVAGALKAFDGAYSDAITRAVSRKNPSPDFVAEATQRLRERLFVASNGLPRIAEYSGRAALRTWLTIAASHTALMLLRSDTRWRRAADLGDAPAVNNSPELTLLKRQYARDFAAAVAYAFTQLSEKERTILQLNVVERHSIDALGKLYKVGRATAARWLASARATLVDETRQRLRRVLGLTDSECESLGPIVCSQLDVSISKLLYCDSEHGSHDDLS